MRLMNQSLGERTRPLVSGIQAFGLGDSLGRVVHQIVYPIHRLYEIIPCQRGD